MEYKSLKVLDCDKRSQVLESLLNELGYSIKVEEIEIETETGILIYPKYSVVKRGTNES